MTLAQTITITELSERSGVRPSALRFYESLGLIEAERTPGNHRRYNRATLRRVSVIRAAQGLGLTLEQIGAALAALPDGRTPTPDDWSKMAAAWQALLDQRIAVLERLRDNLSSCIGCGCLSLETCGLLNQGDHAASMGSGARYLMGDEPGQLPAGG